MRKWLMAAAAGVLLGGGAVEAHATGPVRIEASAGKSGSALASAMVDPEAAGTWTFVADVQGEVDDVLLQLWKPSSRGACAGEGIDQTGLSGSNDPAVHKRHVDEGVYRVTLESPSDGVHCVRVILWAERGAWVGVDVYEPGVAEPVVDDSPVDEVLEALDQVQQ